MKSITKHYKLAITTNDGVSHLTEYLQHGVVSEDGDYFKKHLSDVVKPSSMVDTYRDDTGEIVETVDLIEWIWFAIEEGFYSQNFSIAHYRLIDRPQLFTREV
jgi:hypothetical protein